jgi:hypothetical protein
MLTSRFLEQISQEKNSILVVIACSGSKREDDGCDRLVGSQDFDTSQQALAALYPSVTHSIEDFRECTKGSHPTAMRDASQYYPAFIRYSGNFYRSVEEVGLKAWNSVEVEEWNVLILSAYYGFIHIAEGISYYDFQISRLRSRCRRKLPTILEAYLRTNPHINRVLFLTSRAYTKPFIGMRGEISRVSLLDESGARIMGARASDFYRHAGKLFAAMISNDPGGVDRVREVRLESL